MDEVSELPVSTARRSELLRLLHDQHGPDLLRYANRQTSDSQMAEDIVQETMAKAWKNLRLLEGDPEAIRPWMFTVARNLIIDDRRRVRHRYERTVSDVHETSTRDDFATILDRMLIADALATLSAGHSGVVIDAHYLGRSVADIASRHEIPEGTVKSRLHYGLRALRLALQERGVTR